VLFGPGQLSQASMRTAREFYAAAPELVVGSCRLAWQGGGGCRGRRACWVESESGACGLGRARGWPQPGPHSRAGEPTASDSPSCHRQLIKVRPAARPPGLRPLTYH